MFYCISATKFRIFAGVSSGSQGFTFFFFVLISAITSLTVFKISMTTEQQVQNTSCPRDLSEENIVLGLGTKKKPTKRG